MKKIMEMASEMPNGYWKSVFLMIVLIYSAIEDDINFHSALLGRFF